ncbi:MAG: DbpA RNA binding domain-containing protein, partial [Halobacteria archaeon]|nr:DbpA RNA binding domain-containing protein [Halobacteria archaeon]
MQAQESESSDTEAQTEVLITGLRDEEPGDVVGAFTNEADVDPEAIGEISIEDAEATVEVGEDTVDRVVDEVDRVGRSEVCVRRLDDETEAVREYVKYLGDKPRSEISDLAGS